MDTNPQPKPQSPRAASHPEASAVHFPGRPLPHSLEAERNLLACCLAEGRPGVTRCVAARLTPAAFYNTCYGRIFEAMLALHARQDEIDAATLAEELKTTGDLEAVGGYARITEVSSYLPPAGGGQLVFFLRAVREHWILRELIRAGSKLIEDAYQPRSGDLAELISPHVAWFQSALARIVHGERGALSLQERIAAVKASLAARASGTEDKSGWIFTGLARFDEKARPLGSDAEDHFIVLGGGSGHGKSALLRQWAGQALKDGKRVLNYTRETSVAGWIRQLASNWARVDLASLDSAPADHAKRIQDECDRIDSYRDKSLFVYQHEQGCPIETIEQLVAHARAWAWQHGAPHLLIVDYLQLFGTQRRMNNREQEVAHVAHSLQALQRELATVIVVAAQLNEAGLREMRVPKKTEDGRLIHRLPTPGDFRESQAIYHDADRAICLYRPPESCRGDDNLSGNLGMPEIWICQIKRRYGGECDVRCWFEKRHLLFKEFGRAEAETAPLPTQAPAPKGRTPADKLAELQRRRAGLTDEQPY